ncbi:EAL domain-containing protein [Vibrio hannami]|uniref:EAL domain-containing protein n=1 Tax=Vibrio hannami TaxID=2717094 RepID=UPI0024107CA8|nr:EAL domain-containing protein [Vibrio hannami]MDG3088316.1 EAL domain-containing protein [Vibrio hannami]
MDFSAKRVLLLISYHPTFPTSSKVMDGLLAEFGDNPPEIEVEFMDSKRLHDETSRQLFQANISYKLLNREPYDVVITADDNALHFMLDNGETLLPDTPFVFLGLNNIKLARLMGSNTLATGVVEAVSIRETIELALQIKQDIRSIYIVSDGTSSGRSDLESTLKLKEQFPGVPFKVINLADISWPDFITAIKGVPKESAIILLSAYRDKYSESYSFESSLEIIVNNSLAPIFHPFEHGMGDGVLGGVVISHREQAKQAAIKAKQLFSGVKAIDIPILDKSPNVVVADKRVLDRFGIEVSQLPEGAEIRYSKETMFQKYWKELLGIIVIMSLMMLIIIILVHQNRAKARFAKTLSASESRLRKILDNIDAFVYMKDAKGRYLFANKLMYSLFPSSINSITSKSDKELFDEDVSEQRERTDNAVIESQILYKGEENLWLENGRQILQSTKIPLVDDKGNTYALCSVSVDITEQKEHEKQLKKIAHYDQLTGLPNRVLFSDRLSQAMKHAIRQNSIISVLYMDLDGFKQINDTYGHIFGDRLLKVVTSRLQQVIRENDTAARLGGDEFIILLINSGKPEDDLEITQRILSVISEPMSVDGVVVSVSGSIGITRFPQEDEIEADHLLRQADQAMYTAKNSGRNRYHFFNSDLEQVVQKQELLIKEVGKAIDRNEFRLFYQPKVDLETGHVVGVEALIRWEHPEKGLLPPAAFLPDIEKHSLMIDIDDWVIGEALRQIKNWLRSGLSIPVSINISHIYFNQQNLAQVLKQELAEYPDVSPSLLELEILETQALENLGAVATVILECQELGISFALDDFGTGFSSLTYLKQLPINMLKVDRSFVIDMLEDEEDRSILEGILALSQAFNIKPIAEGLETVEHGIELKKMGYRYAQGYGIAKPMAAHEVPLWINGWSVPKEWNCPVDEGWDYGI